MMRWIEKRHVHVGMLIFHPVHVSPLQPQQDVGNELPWIVVYNQSLVYGSIMEECLMVEDPVNKSS